MEYCFGRLHALNDGQTQSKLEEQLESTLTSSCVVEDDMAYTDYMEEL